MSDAALAINPAADAAATVSAPAATFGAWPDRATICHPNSRGTGSAIRFELHPARGRTSGYLFVELARQKSLASQHGAVPSFATFDWANKIVVKMGINDLAQMLMVFRGMQESILDGKGLFHRSAKANAVIKFAHQIEPSPGYLFSASCKPFDGERKDGYFVFRPEEAVWFSSALDAMMGVLVFGVPSAAPEGAL
ncbi:MAG: hypothetical protein II649_03940 [Kiritimatiellae bacterium]|nr:hypothetical protein [Kiritimatiellia bacterium]